MNILNGRGGGGSKIRKLTLFFLWVNTITFKFLQIQSGCSNSFPIQLIALFLLNHVKPTLDLHDYPVNFQFLALPKSHLLY